MLKEAVVADEDRNFYHHGGVDLRGTLRALYDDIRHKGAAAGRLDHHPAVREAGLHQPAAHPGPQGPRGHPGQPARPRGQQGRDPVPLPDAGLFRRRQLRDRRRGRELLPRPGQRARRLPGRHAGRAHPGPQRPGPPGEPRRRRGGQGAGAQGDAPTGLPDRGPVPRGPAAAAGARQSAGPSRTGSTVVYPDQAATDRVPRLRRLRDPLAAGTTSRRRRCTAAGLRVQTTLDPTVQAAAYAAVGATLSGTSPPLDMALATVEPRPASCPPWSAAGASAVDVAGQPGPRRLRPAAGHGRHACRWPPPAGPARRITGGGQGRQPGSAWKPFTLATAFEQGIQPIAAYPAPGRLPDPRLQGARRPAGQRLPDPQRRARQHHRHRDPCRGHGGVHQHRLRPGGPPGGLQQRGHHRQDAGDRVGLLLDAAVLLLPELRPRRGRRVAPRHGVRLRRLRRPRPAGRRRRRSSRSSTAPARSWSTTSARCPRPPPPCRPTWPTT